MTPATRDRALLPEVVGAIEDLELTARLVVEGMRTGGNRSPFPGSSAEFRQHREYRAGDDLKRLDWKLFARSDRLYTRQYNETTNVPVMLVLDASGSMDFAAASATRRVTAQTPGHSPATKFRYGVVLAAALAYLASTQGDAVGLVTMADSDWRYLPARGGRPHLRVLLATLDRLVPGGPWDLADAIDRAARRLRRRGIVVVISDLYGDDAATTRALRRATRHGHDVAVLHLLSPDELTLGDHGAIEYEDLETGERILTDATAAGPAYAARVAGFAAALRNAVVPAGIDYARVMTDLPPGRALRDFLLRRGARHVAERAHKPVRG